MVLPADFISRTTALLGDAGYCELQTSLLDNSPVVSIRMNGAKSDFVPTGEAVAWCRSGFYLPERLAFTFDPLFHAGVYYVQEACSMFLEQAIRAFISSPVVCLDLCAAPGGKSTHLANLLPQGSLLVCNEVIGNRSPVLLENMTKWGYPAAVVTRNDPAEIGQLAPLFDLIVVDAPCSGEGMFRKDPDSAARWSTANVALCALRQRRILQDIWPALKPGGILIYSTCTYNMEENENILDFARQDLGAQILPIQAVKKEWNITGSLKGHYPAYRFFPHKTKGEGFFMAILRKEDENLCRPKIKSDRKNHRSDTIPPASVQQWITDPYRFKTETIGNFVRAIPREWEDVCRYLSRHLRVLSAGIQLGEIKGKEVIPLHALALSTQLCRDAFQTIAVSPEEAVRYLKKEALVLPHGTAKGYLLITCKGHPIGFVKHLGSRTNNLYPTEWRIRTGHTPDPIRTLY